MVLFYALGYSVRCLEEGCEAVDGGAGTFGLKESVRKVCEKRGYWPTSTISIINGLISGLDSFCTSTSSSIVLQTM